MIKRTDTLPEGYAPIYSVDLQKNKKMMLLVNAIAIALAAALAVPAAIFVPISSLFEMESGIGVYFLRFGVLLFGSLLYIVLHECVHGAVMKLLGTKRVKYGFTGMYAFAGSDDYYGKLPYIIIALAPVLLFGVIFGILSAALDGAWFWVVWILEISNISGAAGDFFVSFKFLSLPADILVRDFGVGMTVYSRKEENAQ